MSNVPWHAEVVSAPVFVFRLSAKVYGDTKGLLACRGTHDL